MKIIKKLNGHTIEYELEKIKSYSRFTLYQVYKLIDNIKVPVYRECYTNLDLRKILANGGEINEEIDYDVDTDLTKIIESDITEDDSYYFLLADLLEDE